MDQLVQKEQLSKATVKRKLTLDQKNQHLTTMGLFKVTWEVFETAIRDKSV